MLSFERQQLYHSKTKKGTNFVFQTPKVVFRATKVVSTIKLPCGFPRFPSLSVRSTHQGNHIETPQGGSSKGACFAAFPPGLRPAPRALLRVGRHAPRPPGLRPLVRLRAPGPCCLGHPAGRLRGTGAPGGRGGQRAALSTLDAQPLLPLNSVFSKGPAGPRKRGGVWGGVPPQAGRRWATRPRRWAVRVQPQAVPAVHGLGEVVHGRPGYGAERSRLFGCPSLCVLRTE